MRVIPSLIILLAALPAGCALTPQALEMAHPELRPKKPPLSAKAQYLEDCTGRIRRAWSRLADAYDERSDADERALGWQGEKAVDPTWNVDRSFGRPQRLEGDYRSRRGYGLPRTEIRATFQILANGSVENLDIQSVTGLSPLMMTMTQNAFTAAHLPPMPPKVAAECGGRLQHELWF